MHYIMGLFFLFCFPLFGKGFANIEKLNINNVNVTKIQDHFNKNPLTVISTTDELRNQSESALIAFTQNSDLELYFMTFVDSRKFANLQINQSVSLVIGFDHKTVQYEGVAFALTDLAVEEALNAFSKKNTPCSIEFLSDPRARFFKVIPKWIRYSDYTVFPAEIFEVVW